MRETAEALSSGTGRAATCATAGIDVRTRFWKAARGAAKIVAKRRGQACGELVDQPVQAVFPDITMLVFAGEDIDELRTKGHGASTTSHKRCSAC